MIILEENFKWHLEAFASELFKYSLKRSIAFIKHYDSIMKIYFIFCITACFHVILSHLLSF